MLFLLPSILILLVRCSKATEVASTESEDYDDDRINWQCGTDEFTKYISENQIDIDCPNLKLQINNCCLTHDSCYDDQLGRKFCDDTFCSCLDEQTRTSVICNKEDGPLFCGLVRQFGEDAYLRSGNGTVTEGSGEDDLTNDGNITSENSTHVDDYEASSGLSDREILSPIKHELLEPESDEAVDSYSLI